MLLKNSPIFKMQVVNLEKFVESSSGTIKTV
jgi:hypothetical protein